MRTEAKADEVFTFDTLDDKWRRRAVLKVTFIIKIDHILTQVATTVAFIVYREDLLMFSSICSTTFDM